MKTTLDLPPELIDEAMRAGIETEMEALDDQDEPAEAEDTLRTWVREYHRETGL